MKFTAILLSLLAFATTASAMQEDGCYALYQSNSENGVLCISGTMEEGIGGSNIRFMFYSHGQARWCGRTTRIQAHWSQGLQSVVKYHFSPKSPISSILMTWTAPNQKKEGKVRFNEGRKTDLLYLKLSQQMVARLEIGKAFNSATCQAGLNLR